MASPPTTTTTLLLLFLPILLHHSSAQTTVVKAIYWFPESGMAASAIDSTLFTHIFCAFADLNPSTNRLTISPANAAPFSTFTQAVRQKNPSVKTLLSIGGGNASVAASYAAMASEVGSRSAFIGSSIGLARANGFHGLDLDWESPEPSAAEMADLGALVTEWRAAVESEATSSGEARLLLTAAVYYSSNKYSFLYPVQDMNSGLDWINVMAYDFYAPGWTPQIAGPSAALYNSESEPSGDSGITAWIESGMASKKIVLGFPYYGHQWRLTNANNNGLFAPANGSAGEAMTYAQIRSFIVQNGAQTVYNGTVKADYCYSGTTWVSYDDAQTISAKVTYAKKKALLGYFAWHAAGDDNWALSRLANSNTSGSAKRRWRYTHYIVETILLTIYMGAMPIYK